MLAGGGTAGHTSPLIATAYELADQLPGIRITALGTERGLETTVVPAAGLPLELIPPVPMPRRPTLELFRVPGRLRTSIKAAERVLRETDAAAVLGFGGYVSTPAYLAARRLKLPIVVHEQNVLPGLANKLAARFTEHVYTSFEDTVLPHATCIGLPMRRAITELDRLAERAAARREYGLAEDLPVLLVSGGSQGAARINTAVEGARDDLLASGIQVLHALGPKNFGAQNTGTPTTYTHPEQRRGLPAAGVRREDGTGVCGRRPDARPLRREHRAGDRGRRAALPCSCPTRTATASSAATPGRWSTRAAACSSRTPTAPRSWSPLACPELVHAAGRLAGMSVALRGVARADAASTLARRTLEVARRWA